MVLRFSLAPIRASPCLAVITRVLSDTTCRYTPYTHSCRRFRRLTMVQGEHVPECALGQSTAERLVLNFDELFCIQQIYFFFESPVL